MASRLVKTVVNTLSGAGSSDDLPPSAGARSGGRGNDDDGEEELTSSSSDYEYDDEEEFLDEDLEALEGSQLAEGVRSRLISLFKGKKKKKRKKDRKLIMQRKMDKMDKQMKKLTDTVAALDDRAVVKRKGRRCQRLRVPLPKFAFNVNLLKKGEEATTSDEENSPKYTLASLQQQKLMDHLFTRNRFTGDKGMTIKQFLECMNRGQRSCHLTEEDFKEVLLMRTLGEPYHMIDNWIALGESVEYIYSNLYQVYNTDLEPSEATNMISEYRPPRGLSFPEIVAELNDLATQASMDIELIPDRKKNHNQLSLMALGKCLPQNSTRYVKEETARFLADTGRHPTFSELIEALVEMYPAINMDLKNPPSDYRFGKPRVFMKFTTKGSDLMGKARYGGFQKGNNNKNMRINKITAQGEDEEPHTTYVNALDSQPGTSRPQNSGKQSNNRQYKPKGNQGNDNNRVLGGKNY